MQVCPKLRHLLGACHWPSLSGRHRPMLIIPLYDDIMRIRVRVPSDAVQQPRGRTPNAVETPPLLVYTRRNAQYEPKPASDAEPPVLPPQFALTDREGDTTTRRRALSGSRRMGRGGRTTVNATVIHAAPSPPPGQPFLPKYAMPGYYNMDGKFVSTEPCCGCDALLRRLAALEDYVLRSSGERVRFGWVVRLMCKGATWVGMAVSCDCCRCRHFWPFAYVG